MQLREIRQAFGVSQNIFASHMGLPLRTFEDLEAGRTATREIHIRAAFWAAMELASDMAMPGALPQDVQHLVRKLAAAMNEGA